MKHIVIAGGGFAGVRLARQLRKYPEETTVTVINNSDDFRYSPALYRVATGFKTGIARIPIEWMLLDAENVNFVQGTVTKIDGKKREFTLADGRKIHYDYAVCAMGMVTTYFGIKGIGEHSFGIKSTDEIQELKQHVHKNVTENRDTVQNYIVIGAGPTGVEVAANLGQYIQSIKRKHRFKHSTVQVHLVEAAPRVLPTMSLRASKRAYKELLRRGVHIHTDTKVTSQTKNILKTSEGNLATQNVIWTAGMVNNPFYGENPREFSLNQQGKVRVDSHLQTKLHKNIYVAGDNSDTQFSGLAYTAVGHGNFLAKDIMRRIRGKRRPSHTDAYPLQIVPVGTISIFQYRGIVLAGRYINILRRVADLVGYSDVLGTLRALTIWRNDDRMEEPSCAKCRV